VDLRCELASASLNADTQASRPDQGPISGDSIAVALHELLDKHLRRTAMLERGLAAAIALVPSPAFLMHEGGVIEFANAAARTWLKQGGEIPRFGERREGVSITLVSAAGMPRHAVVVVSVPVADRQERLALAAVRWRLTPKQSAVLETLLGGDANKSIAKKHQCAESPIEIHVTALLAKAGVANRTALIAKFWSD